MTSHIFRGKNKFFCQFSHENKIFSCQLTPYKILLALTIWLCYWVYLLTVVWLYCNVSSFHQLKDTKLHQGMELKFNDFLFQFKKWLGRSPKAVLEIISLWTRFYLPKKQQKWVCIISAFLVMCKIYFKYQLYSRMVLR